MPRSSTDRRPVNLALLGAGARGELNLATLAARHPHKLRFVAVAEPDQGRREHFVKNFSIPRQNTFSDWKELVARPQLADAVLNALPCHMHHESTIAALRSGYHVFLEKPMAHGPEQCLHLERVAKEADRILMIATQSRYNRIYSKISRMLAEQRIGRLMNVDCCEDMGYWHFIMSYVRGIHSRSVLSHSSLLAKGIHDIDLVVWLTRSRARQVASFGGLSFFNRANAPAGSTRRCIDCLVETSCEFSAVKQYLSPGSPDIPWSLLGNMTLGAVVDYVTHPRFRTLASVVTHDISPGNRRKLLEESVHGQCVFLCDNDVMDHQTVSLEFENGVTASFSLSGFSLIWERTLNLHGTRGEIRSRDFTGKLELRTFNPGRVHRERVRYHGIVHGGGDEMILLAFAKALRSPRPDEVLPSVASSLESHLICFAAEEARREGKVVQMEEFRRRAEESAFALS